MYYTTRKTQDATMVKTRNQNRKDCAMNSKTITEGVVTRSQKHKGQQQQQQQQPHNELVRKSLKKKVLPKVELTDRIKDKIKKRQQLRKQIHHNQTSILNKIQTEITESKKQNNEEMTSVWKNFESIFKFIDKFTNFII
jgi:hypothetical protein